MDSQIIYSGSDGQQLTDVIAVNDRPLDLTGKTVKFKMRNADSDTLKVNSNAVIDDAEEGSVSYTWSDANLDTPGEYWAWWEVKTGSANLDTPEFLVIVTKHSPGLRTETGAFYAQAKSHLPITWAHLEQEQGDAVLQNIVEVVKLKLFNATIAVEDEIDYDLRIQSYAGKCIALAVIPRAIDYWMNQHQSLSATGTNENVSFPDRIEALKALQERLLSDIAKERDEVEALIGVPTLMPLTGVPGLSLGKDQGFATPLAQDHFNPYAFPQRNKQPW